MKSRQPWLCTALEEPVGEPVGELPDGAGVTKVIGTLTPGHVRQNAGSEPCTPTLFSRGQVRMLHI